eukprot:Stramenopile-MAST_4_protein_2801
MSLWQRVTDFAEGVKDGVVAGAVATKDGAVFVGGLVVSGVVATGHGIDVGILQPSAVQLKKVWKQLDHELDTPSKDLALFRTCMDNGLDLKMFEQRLNNVPTDATDYQIDKAFEKAVKQMTAELSSEAASELLAAGGESIDSAESKAVKEKYDMLMVKRLHDLEEAREWMKKPLLKRQTDANLYFVRHALDKGKLLHYEWESRSVSCIDQRVSQPYEVDWQRLETPGDGRTCMHVAAFYGHGQIVEALLDENWSTSIVDKQGMTPIDYANIGLHYKLAKAMRLAGNHNLLFIELLKRGLVNKALETFHYARNPAMPAGTAIIDVYDPDEHGPDYMGGHEARRCGKLLKFQFIFKSADETDSSDDDSDDDEVFDNGEIIFVERENLPEDYLLPFLVDKTTPFARLVCTQRCDAEDDPGFAVNPRKFISCNKQERFRGFKKTSKYWVLQPDDTPDQNDEHVIDDYPRGVYFAPVGCLKELDYVVDYVEPSTTTTPSDGCTALHVAASKGQREIVHMLLELGWSKTLKNAEGLTPIDVAKANKYHSLARSMKMHGDHDAVLYAAVSSQLEEEYSSCAKAAIKILSKVDPRKSPSAEALQEGDGYLLEFNFHLGQPQKETENIVRNGLERELQPAKFGRTWQDAKFDEPALLNVVSAYWEPVPVDGGGTKLFLRARRGTTRHALMLKEKMFSCATFDGEKHLLPRRCAEWTVPRYSCDWVHPEDHRSVLEEAERVAHVLKQQYTNAMENRESATAIKSALKKVVRAFTIVKLLFRRGWNHSESEKWWKNHNLLLIKALESTKSLENVYEHVTKNTLLRYNGVPDESGFLAEDLVEFKKQPGKQDDGSQFQIGCPLGVLTLTSHSAVSKHETMPEKLFFDVGETIYALFSYNPFTLLTQLRASKDVDQLQTAQQRSAQWAQTNALKLSKRQIPIHYAPDFVDSCGSNAVDMINDMLSSAGDALSEKERKMCFDLKESLVDLGWTDYGAALTSAQAAQTKAQEAFDAIVAAAPKDPEGNMLPLQGKQQTTFVKAKAGLKLLQSANEELETLQLGFKNAKKVQDVVKKYGFPVHSAFEAAQ